MLDTISVIGGGWSVSQLKREEIPGQRIGVNDAGVELPCHRILSMDRLWTEHRWPKVLEQLDLGTVPHIRVSALKNIVDRPQGLGIFQCDHTSTTMSDESTILNGTNSGMCALNLAYVLRPQRVLLFGFDHKPGPNGERYWYDDYPWKGGTGSKRYAEWAKQYARAHEQFKAKGIEVLNVSTWTAVEAFPVIHPRELGL